MYDKLIIEYLIKCNINFVYDLQDKIMLCYIIIINEKYKIYM